MSDNPPPPGSCIARQYFYTGYTKERLEEEAVNELLTACGVDPEAPTTWPLSDVTFDPYDYSFEFKRVTPGWTPTPAQLAACFALGFARCWICYTDGTESYASDTQPLTRPKYARVANRPFFVRVRNAYRALRGR